MAAAPPASSPAAATSLAFESDYEAAPMLYSRSEPGLGSVLKAAVLMATRDAKGDSTAIIDNTV